jgi:hypothetical protein
MRQLRLVVAAVFVACVVPLGMASAALAAGGSRNDVYSFDLAPADTAASPNGGTMMASPGDWISLTGSGTFNPTARTVSLNLRVRVGVDHRPGRRSHRSNASSGP